MFRLLEPNDLERVDFWNLVKKSLRHQPNCLKYDLKQIYEDLKHLNIIPDDGRVPVIGFCYESKNGTIKAIWIGTLTRMLGSKAKVLYDFLVASDTRDSFVKLMSDITAKAKEIGCDLIFASPAGRKIKVIERWFKINGFIPYGATGYKILRRE
ncbi:MAG: hypothetical protein QXJ06_00615 [Candidatus Aenigmatarchaeota archaeon]